MRTKIVLASFCMSIILTLWLGKITFAQNRAATDSLVFTEFYSQILKEKRRLIVHLPLNYAKEPTKKYPVMYVLDGGNQDVHTSDQISVLAKTGLIPECIVVGVLNTKTSRNRDQTPPFMQTETDDPKSPFGEADHFLKFLEEEIIPKIDSNYRINGYKTLTGHSRGGLFVLYSLIKKPSLFDARFCYSTPVWRFDDLMIKKTIDFLRTQKPKKTFLFLSAGDDETTNIVGGFNRLSLELKNFQKNIAFYNYLTPLANHQQNPIVATPKALYQWGEYLKTNSIKN